MKDHCGRTINYLRVSVTDRCNLRCQYCMPAEGIAKKQHEALLSFESLLKIIETTVSLGVDKVRITGGEPLVRRGIVDFVSAVKALPGVKTLAMTTNAILLEEMAGPLKKAGLDRVNISLDTLDPLKFKSMTRGGDLSKALAGIEAAKRAGLTPIKINTVLIRGFNDDEVDALIALSDGDVEVRFIELMPIGQAATWTADRFLSGKALLDERADLIPIAALGDGPSRFYQKRSGGGRVGLIDPISDHFCDRCNRMRLTADGALKPCLHSDTEIDLAPYLSKDHQLRERVAEAILQKPARHHIQDPDFVPIERSMYRIGG